MLHTLIDLCYLSFTIAFVVGSVFIIALFTRKCSAAVDATKSSLEKRGWKVSSHGVSVPMPRRSLLDRERYLDATQRGLSKAADASTFGGTPQQHLAERTNSNLNATAERWSRRSAADLEQKHHRRHLFKRHGD